MKKSQTSAIGARGSMMLRLVFVAASILIGVLPFEPDLLGVSGAISPVQSWWLVMTACSLFMAAAAVGTEWRWTGLVAASFLAGFSAQLALTEPLWFPSIRIRPTSNFSYLFLLAILVQATFSAGILFKRVKIFVMFRFLKALGLIRTALVFVLVLGLSVTAMRYIGNSDYAEYLNQLFLASGFLVLNLGTTIAVALTVPPRSLGRLADRASTIISFPGTISEARNFDHYLPGIVALWTLIASSVLCVLAFERMPRVPDEVVYLFHAKYFQQGQISLPMPPSVEALDFFLLDHADGKWFSVNMPGWPAVLALGTALKSPWLVNPVLGAICILLVHAVFRRVADRGVANVIVLFLAISPWFLATSASLMSHTLTLALLLTSWLLLLRARADNSIYVAVLAGALMGYITLTRPLDGLVIGTLTGIWTFSFLVDRSRWLIIVGYGLGCIAISALILPYNQYLTGDALLSPLNSYANNLWYPGANRIGFGPDIGPENRWLGIDLYRGHSPVEALINLQHNAYSVNFELFGWGVGSLVLVFAHAVWGRWSRIDLYMLAVVTVMVGAYSLYWFTGSFYIGPRYWFMTLLPLTAISVSGARALASRLDGANGAGLAAQRLTVVIVLLCVVSAGSFLTWRGATKYHGFRGFHTDYRELIEEHDLHGSLIFVKTSSETDFGSAFVLNSPSFSGPDPIFARDLGLDSNRALANKFPDRPIYFVAGRAGYGTKAHIVGGPISSQDLR